MGAVPRYGARDREAGRSLNAAPCRPAIEKGEVARTEVEPYHQLRADAAQGRVPAAVWEAEKPDPWPPDPHDEARPQPEGPGARSLISLA